jgi:hypothetical protein
MVLQWLDPALPSDAFVRARALRPAHDAVTAAPQDRDATISYRDSADQSLAAAARASFAAAFARERATLEAWLQRAAWAPSPLPALEVFVSADYKISRALVPAWDGCRGRMEFPLWRVRAGKAAILHELVHVYLPNGNRFLAEGLAIYLQAVLGGNPAFPNFGRPLHDVTRAHLRELVPARDTAGEMALASIDLAALDAVPTPNPLALRAVERPGIEEPRAQAAIYAIAGSFLQFLIEAYGLAKFRALYACTPLRAGALDAGSPARWCDAYGRSLMALEAEWKALIAGADRPPAARGSR